MLTKDTESYLGTDDWESFVQRKPFGLQVRAYDSESYLRKGHLVLAVQYSMCVIAASVLMEHMSHPLFPTALFKWQ